MRRFPPPWTVEALDGGFKVVDANGQAIAPWSPPRLAQSVTGEPNRFGRVPLRWAGLGIVLIALVGWFWFRQTLDVPALIGLALIVGGVVLVNAFSQSPPH